MADGKNLLKVDGTNTIIDEWIMVAGGQNAVSKAGNMLEINAEEIININPDVIIIGRAKAPEILKKTILRSSLCRHKRCQKQKSLCKSSWRL